MNRKILVTGGSGFIGSHVVKRLILNGDKPIVITRRSSNNWRLANILDQIEPFDIEQTSMVKLFQSEDIKGVINLATYYRKHNSFGDIEKMIESNVKFPTELLQLCKEYNVPVFVTAGSYFQYSTNYSSYGTKTTTSRDLYAATKSALTKIMEYYSYGSGLDTVELILFTPYGEMDHEEKLIPYLIRNGLRGNTANLSEGFQKLNLVYVDDVASAFVKALDIHCNGIEHINIANLRSYSIRDIVTVIEEILEIQMRVKWNSMTTGNIDMDDELIVDTKLSESILKWKPQYDIYQGLKKTIDYYNGEKNAN